MKRACCPLFFAFDKEYQYMCMDLHSGLPYWIVKNELFSYYNPLRKDHKSDVVIIGSGITGALVAHTLCEAGIRCTIVDKRTLATGSTAASTSQLQYEIDVPLYKMIKKVGEDHAVRAYHASLTSVQDIEDVFSSVHLNPDFSRCSSVYLASNATGQKIIEREYEVRIKHGLPVTFLNEKELWQQHAIKGSGALKNKRSAQMDAYKAATQLIQYHMQHSGLAVYSHTQILSTAKSKQGYILKTAQGNKIACDYLIIAAGFEAGEFLPKSVMKLQSTYALISQPIDANELWPERALLWETKEPYFYMRTTKDNRMIIGGGDVEYQNPQRRDSLLRRKIHALEKQFKKLYPNIPFVVDMAWCGTFSSTEDGLPFIGEWPNKENMFYALGYGGNGITFSMIAAQIIRNKILAIPDEREEIFGFDRILQ
jgi:glycine/D-amino acid oxidase-like deaminating enzyme